MNVHRGIEGLSRVPAGSVMSIGNFDGLHVGHARIIQTLGALRAATIGGSRAVVVTFEPHPLTILRPQLAPPRLTGPAIKQQLLEAAGVDDLVVLAPTRDVLGLTAEQFWGVLRDEVRPSHLVEGASFNFGKDRGGTIEKLREWSAASSVKLHVVDAVRVALLDLHVVDVNSSLIRWLISYGRMRDAAICLGRAYVLHGKVVRGYRRGKEIGTPTANIDCGDQLIPADGVYVGRCQLDGARFPVALSIGSAPTFGENRRQVEAHVVGFDGDLYERVVEIEVVDWIREQVRFEGVEALKRQLRSDLERVNACWDLLQSRSIAQSLVV
jgi:riboflavin kinase/FMN adenylyltransferase